MLNFLFSRSQFILDHIILPFISSFIAVVGGAMPIAILVYIFSKKEKVQLQAYADAIEKTLPLQEQLLKKYAEILEKSISPQTIEKSIDNFKGYIEAQNMFEENKKFIEYAKNYNFISAVGHILRMSNYIPKGINEHKEISKNLPNSLSR
jgi:hypothetical protein